MQESATTAEREKARGLATILAYLEELRGSRPTVVLSADRSAKGCKTIRDILAATRAVFLREGHGGLSMRMAADEAGIALGNLSYYFPTKRLLLEAMLKEELADYVEAHIREFDAAGDSPLEILLNVMNFYVANARCSHPFFFQMWGYAASDPHAKALVRDLYRPIGRFILSMVRAANPALADAEARRAVLQIFSLEEGVKLFIGMGPDDDPALKTAERDIRALTRRIVLGV